MMAVYSNVSLDRWQAATDGPFSLVPAQLSVPSMIQGPHSSPYIYREPQRSECGESTHNGMSRVPLSDSGYETLPQGTASVVSHQLDRNPELGGLARAIRDLNTGYTHQSHEPFAWSFLPPDSNAKGPFHCHFPGCRSPECKTRSELNKHHARHMKPFKCDVIDCKKSTQGFSTQNDLDRHKRSVHNTDGPRYRCNHGSCQTKDKLWPRADNFKAHLERAHQITINIDQLGPYKVNNEFMNQAPPMYNNNNDVLMCSGSKFDGTDTPLTHGGARDGDEIILDEDPGYPSLSPTGPDSSQNTSYFLTANNELGASAQPNSYPPETFSLHRDQLSYSPSSIITQGDSARRISDANRQLDSNRPTTPMSIVKESHETQSMEVPLPTNTLPALRNAPPTHATPAPISSSPVSTNSQSDGRSSRSSQTSTNFPQDIGISLNSLKPEQLKKFLDELQAKGVLEKHGYVHARSQTSESGESQDEKKSEVQEGSFKCQEHQCRKSFSRQCELTKHMKRHEKPYGCTFAKCSKKFGSKNDWKRHENSQHFQLEVWKCDVLSEPGDKGKVPCGKVSHRRETFRCHLQQGHNLSDKEIDQRLEKCRIGRNWEGAFWCGFCKKRVSLKKKGREGWDERFNHIDNHFFGKGPDGKKHEIEQWEGIDPDQMSLDDACPESGGSEGRSGKRKNSFGESSIAKRARNGYMEVPEGATLLVSCCRCPKIGGFMGSMDLNDRCAIDGHAFCEYCPKEVVMPEQNSPL